MANAATAAIIAQPMASRATIDTNLQRTRRLPESRARGNQPVRETSMICITPRLDVGSMRPTTSATNRRRNSGPKPLVECGSFATLAKKADTLEALDRALRQTLPLPLREHVHFADRGHDRLVFLASSPAWASRLRMLQPQILASARAIGVGASALKIKVVAPEHAAAPTTQLKFLSPATATHLRAAAASFPDPELRALFLALASATNASGTPEG